MSKPIPSTAPHGTETRIDEGVVQEEGRSSRTTGQKRQRQQYFNRHHLSMLRPNRSVENPTPETRIYGAVVKKGRRRISTIFSIGPEARVSKKLEAELIDRVRRNGSVGAEVERLIPGITVALAKRKSDEKRPELKQRKITDMFVTKEVEVSCIGKARPPTLQSKSGKPSLLSFRQYLIVHEYLVIKACKWSHQSSST